MRQTISRIDRWLDISSLIMNYTWYVADMLMMYQRGEWDTRTIWLESWEYWQWSRDGLCRCLWSLCPASPVPPPQTWYRHNIGHMPPPSPPLTWPWSRVVKTLADDQETVSGECKIVRSSHTALALDNVAAAALIIEVKLRVSEVRWQYRPDNTSHVDLDKLMLILSRALDHLIRKLYNW